ncbi:MAG: hypothetical protein R3183_10105, partial [Oleiphilaceae bacterium]|nr:hypothetical protein [Oleiphilaceae bacterium]
PGNYYCRLHLNDELHTEELFPEFKERVAKASDRGAPTWLKRTTITLILIATALTIFNELN